jgi:integrase
MAESTHRHGLSGKERMMTMVKKDNKGRNLRTGERQRDNGLYEYRFRDPVSGKRNSIYNANLAALREMEADIQRKLQEGIQTDAEARNLDVNGLFRRYIELREIEPQTRINYDGLWKRHVEKCIGSMKVVSVKQSHIKTLYAAMSKDGYARTTIKLVHGLLFPAFEMAVDDDIIRKNPCRNALANYGAAPRSREALSREDQKRFMEFVKNSSVYNVYYPMLTIMIGTSCRCGEIIGLTWDDVDIRAKDMTIDHQLIYRNLGDGCRFHIASPKTDAGIRNIPLTDAVAAAFTEQKKYQFQMGIDRSFEVDGRSGFVFTSKRGRPMQPGAVNNVLYNIVKAFNRQEEERAEREKRRAELLPVISAHILRHTGCTRMAESGMDVKVLQYLMGHADSAVTMNVYNHISDRRRVEDEMKKIENLMAI